MYNNVELRKLPVGSLCTIAAILETNNDWKKVMSHIPRNPRSEIFEQKYNNEHIKQIEDAARQSNKKCAEILFDEWGTSGRIRPTLSTLKDVVQKAEIYRAADELARMMEEDLPMRPEDGPAAPIDTNISLMLELEQNNGSTAQMKSNPNPNAKSLSKQTTAQVQSAQAQGNVKELSESNIPDFSALNIKTENQEKYQTDLPNITISTNSVIPTHSGIATEVLEDDKLHHFQYKELERVTKKFASRLIYIPDPSLAAKEGQVQGRLAGKVGSGGYGDVYVGYHATFGHIAIKKARQSNFEKKPDIAMRIFNAEVKYLSQFRHKNIVPILGFSMDGPSLCIVCEYIDGGSLDQRIGSRVLTEKERLKILIGTAEGLKYLHSNERPMYEEDQNPVFRLTDSNPTYRKNNFVHGDVKSANILLTRDCEPKLCDFGLAKQYENTFVSRHGSMGTPAYMAPESFSGTITQKVDIYSYGIVMLELLTGQRALVVYNGERVNIQEYVENCTSTEVTCLDPFIDKWTRSKDLFALAKQCTQRDRKLRPTAADVCEKLREIMGLTIDKTESSKM